MGREVCGTDRHKPIEMTYLGRAMTFDSFECA
jgi:hypothetical protein